MTGAALAAVLVAAAPGDETIPLRVELEPGPFHVGFSSELLFDPSRRHPAKLPDGSKYADEPGPRPILINLWYPAEDDGAEPMLHREYFELLSDDERLTRFAAALTAYARGILVQQTFRADEKSLVAADRALLEEMLDAPTLARRDAPPAEGAHPLVIVHAGYGSSFEDNAALCEHLASHGCVVAGSAFQKVDGSSFNVDVHDGTALDVDFLIATLRERPGIDASRAAMIGHSGGAHAAIRQQAREKSELDALVMLDTTQDYYGNLDPRWDYMTGPALAHPERMSVPMLFCAEPHAAFALGDALPQAERWYFTTSLDHDEFTSQGVLAAQLAARRAPADAALAGRATDVRARYAAVARYVRVFLDATLKEQREDLDRLTKELAATELGPEPRAEHTAKGATSPPAYALDAASPPTPRQLRPLIERDGAEKVAALLRKWSSPKTAISITHRICGFALVDELAERSRRDDARTIGLAYVELSPDFLPTLTAIANFSKKTSNPAFATRCFDRLLLLDPTNEVARRELDSLRPDPSK